MVDDVVAVGAARPRLQIRRRIDMADAEPAQIGRERRGVREAEASVKLQAIGSPRAFNGTHGQGHAGFERPADRPGPERRLRIAFTQSTSERRGKPQTDIRAQD